MSLVIGENVTHLYARRPVLAGISFAVGERDRVGLVGRNGEGKTTLLRLISGDLEPTYGSVHRTAGLVVGYLPQESPPLEGTTLAGVLRGVFADLQRRERELERLAGELGDGDAARLARYGRLQAEFEHLGGYDYRRRIEQVLTGLGFEKGLWDRPLARLSGGQRTRAYLARLLVEGPDLLLLDEPTNHLDLEAVEWLEGWLGTAGGAMVIVSHDRYFLDRTTTRTWEVAFGGLEAYRDGYAAYLEQREVRHKERIRRWEAQQAHIARTEDFIRRNIAGANPTQAQSRRTQLERFLREEAMPRPPRHDDIHLHLVPARRTGDKVLGATDLAAGYEEPLVRAERLEVTRGERVAIVGANGSGKTTLLKTLLGMLRPLSGHVEHGAGVAVGYLSQDRGELDAADSAVEAVRAGAPGLTVEAARTLLGSVLLAGEEALKPVRNLSGGQQSRVVLARLAARKATLLALDEPTNHLDIPSVEVLEEALRGFDGTVLFVSHDRFLIQAVATRVWALEDGSVHDILGSWDAYVRWRGGRREAAASSKGPSREAKARREAERRAAIRERRRRETRIERLRERHAALEAEITALEADLERLSEAITQAGEAADTDRVAALGAEYASGDERLQALWREWEEVGTELE